MLFIFEVLDGYFKEFLEYLVEICVKWLDVVSFVSNVFIEFVLNIIGDKEDSSEWMCYFVVLLLFVVLVVNFLVLDFVDVDFLMKCILWYWIVFLLILIEVLLSWSVLI